MSMFHVLRTSRARRSVFVVLVMLLVALGGAPAMASTAQKKKPLSLATVTVNVGPNVSSEPFFVALAQGLFKKYGLTVNWLETTGGGTQDVSVIASGATQFTTTTASNSLISAQQGSGLRGLFSTTVGGPQQITVTQSYAAAHHIPTASSTQAQIAAQFKALKGTHITIAVSSTSGTNVVYMSALAHEYGLTIGPGCSTCDMNLDVVGTVPNSVVAFQAGKADAVANIPPYTTQPNSLVIPDGKLPPVNAAFSSFGDTTITMIQQHPDTVQAFVDGLTDADMVFARQHRAQANADMEQVLLNNGDTQSQAVSATVTYVTYFKNPYETRVDYNRSIAIYNLSAVTPYAMPYSTFFYLHFLAVAEKMLGITLP